MTVLSLESQLWTSAGFEAKAVCCMNDASQALDDANGRLHASASRQEFVVQQLVVASKELTATRAEMFWVQKHLSQQQAVIHSLAKVVDGLNESAACLRAELAETQSTVLALQTTSHVSSIQVRWA